MTQAAISLMAGLASLLVPAATIAGSSPPRTDEVVLDARTPYLTVESNRNVGDKGEESLDVSVETRCGELALLFDHAELVVNRSRFGDVQFVGLPQPGCIQCAPVTLRWFHEPTGYLSFEVNVYRRLEVMKCPIQSPVQEPG